MAKAICRVSKAKGAGSIGGKADHNYRLVEVPNADPERRHLNHEYVLNYETLGQAIDARIQNTGIKRVRQDAVKAMEFVLTASPDVFPRDEAGQIKGDYRRTEWLNQNLKFMQQRYGANLVAFTLHQDEKTPHIHAIVVPITADGRLSAKELFNPKTLRHLQTDYASAMKTFGLERGIEGSRARHVPMKQIYGLQQAQHQAVQEQITPLQQEPQPLTIDKPGTLDLLNLERWRQQQEAKINAEFNRRLDEARQAAEKAQNVAVANATAQQQGKVLQQRLNTSERLKQANYEEGRKTAHKLAKTRADLDQIAVLIDQGQPVNAQWAHQRAEWVRAKVVPQMEADVVASLREPTQDSDQFLERIKAKGYQLTAADGKSAVVRYLVHPETGVRLDFTTAQFGGQPIHIAIAQAMQRTREQEQKRQLSQRPQQAPPTAKQTPQQEPQPTPKQAPKQEAKQELKQAPTVKKSRGVGR